MQPGASFSQLGKMNTAFPCSIGGFIDYIGLRGSTIAGAAKEKACPTKHLGAPERESENSHHLHLRSPFLLRSMVSRRGIFIHDAASAASRGFEAKLFEAPDYIFICFTGVLQALRNRVTVSIGSKEAQQGACYCIAPYVKTDPSLDVISAPGLMQASSAVKAISGRNCKCQRSPLVSRLHVILEAKAHLLRGMRCYLVLRKKKWQFVKLRRH